MLFKLNICLTDKDYLDYNVFWMTRSPYGKKQMTSSRIIIALICCAIAFLSLLSGNFSSEAFIGIIPYAILLVLFELIWRPFFIWIIKGQMKSLKKQGKMGYSANSDMEFYEESFVEITPENKTEQKYSAIERISILTDKVIYIHVNNVMSYVIPTSCFESKDQLDTFIDFIKEKCINVDTY